MSSNDLAIQIEQVSKLFYKQEQRTFKEFLPALFAGKKTVEWFWALDHIDLNIKKGESIGIIGPNGSGKSTLLKLIAGVSKPTQGKLEIHGRVAPLIELGAGFHPELTGKENVYLNGVILGMKRKEIDQKYKDIVNFAGIWDYIDQPIKHYSSGMYMRLAFAIAVHVNPEILIVDEILAVGDDAFQKKCFAKMEEFKKNGVTIIFVSHNLSQIRNFCDRTAYIKFGKLIADGETKQVCNKYEEDQA